MILLPEILAVQHNGKPRASGDDPDDVPADARRPR